MKKKLKIVKEPNRANLFVSINKKKSILNKFANEIRSANESDSNTLKPTLQSVYKSKFQNFGDLDMIKKFQETHEQTNFLQNKLRIKEIIMFTSINFFVSICESIYKGIINSEETLVIVIKPIIILICLIFEIFGRVLIFRVKSNKKLKYIEKFLYLILFIINITNIEFEIQNTNINDKNLKFYLLGAINLLYIIVYKFSALGIAIFLLSNFIYICIRLCSSLTILPFMVLYLALIFLLINNVRISISEKDQLILDLLETQENKEFYKKFLDIFPDGLAFMNCDFKLEYSNQAFKNIFTNQYYNFEGDFKGLENIDYSEEQKNEILKSNSVNDLSLNQKKIKSPKIKKNHMFSKKNTICHTKSKIKSNELNFMENNYSLNMKSKSTIHRSSILNSFLVGKSSTINEKKVKEEGILGRLLHTENDDENWETTIFGKIKKIEFNKNKHLPNICFSNHQTLYEALKETLGRMRVFKQKSNDLKHFNLKFNSVLILKSKLETFEGDSRIMEIRIIPIFHNDEPTVIINTKDCTAQYDVEKLKKTDEYKNILMSYVSHELRTPLNGMLSMMENVKVFVSEEINEKYIIPTVNCGKNLISLVNDILDFEQIRRGKMRLFETEFKLKDLIVGALDLVKMEAQKRKISLEYLIEDEVPEKIFSDPNRLRQIIINLLGNSLKFTTQGSVKIIVSPHEFNIFKIIVKDTGVGIKKEDQNKLFKQFGKLDLGDQNILNTQGVGLGLIISNSLASELGPKAISQDLKGLKVNSEDGKGSEFWFLLENRFKFLEENLDDSQKISISKCNLLNSVISIRNKFNKMENEENSTSENPRPIIHSSLNITSLLHSAQETNPKLDKKYKNYYEDKRCKCPTILIVDDNYFNILTMEHLLKKYNFIIESCLNGAEAIDLIIKKKNNPCCDSYDIIFLDCLMPIKDGYTTATEIKKLIKEKKINYVTVVAVTGNEGKIEEKKCKNAGMDYILTKPPPLDKINEVLEKIFAKKYKKSNNNRSF